MAYYNTRSAIPQAYYTDVTTSTPQAGLTVAAYDPYAVAPLTIPPTGASVGGPVGAAPLPPQHRSSSGAWNVSDDHMLINARASGKNWGQIQATYFPNKTPNACRKRHERLMERKCADDWDARKLERMAKDYMFLRKEIWAPLAQRTGEKWNVVEQKVRTDAKTHTLRSLDTTLDSTSSICHTSDPKAPTQSIPARAALLTSPLL